MPGIVTIPLSDDSKKVGPVTLKHDLATGLKRYNRAKRSQTLLGEKHYHDHTAMTIPFCGASSLGIRPGNAVPTSVIRRNTNRVI